MKKLFKSIKPIEYIIYSISFIAIITFFFVFKNNQYLYLISSLIGITALLFVSKGNPLGQLLTIIFSIFYGIIAYSFKYYGEMITYLGMSAPIALWALVSWLKNPYNGQKNKVKINSISIKEWIIFLLFSLLIRIIFYFILKYLNTPNLIFSTLSVFTSFTAAYLTARRSKYYALCYSGNDIVLIILWVKASFSDIKYLSMVICFIVFLINDSYGFINWCKMNKNQNT